MAFFSSNHGRSAAQSEDLPDPAVPVRNIDFTKYQFDFKLLCDEFFHMTTEQMSAEILVVGNELLNGTTLDTNSFWLTEKLNDAGVMIERKTTIRDSLNVISNSFREALTRKPDWLFSIGGLGPTFDDMTIHGLSVGVHRQMTLDPKAVGMLRQSYRRRGRPFKRLSKASLKMAMMPMGASPLLNSVGTAPGVLVEEGQTKIVALPGVPNEMKQIFLSQVLDKVKESSGYSSTERWLKITGLPESRLAPEVTRLFRLHRRYFYVKSHPSGFRMGRPVLNIQIILVSPNIELASRTKTLDQISNALSEYARRLGASVSRTRLVR